MPSIFIWKSDSPNLSKNVMRVYLGADWMLEDNEYKSYSYSIQQQESLSSASDVMIMNAKLMPRDWIGSELLEVIQVPYQFIKEDDYAKYEIIGNWNRVILKRICNFDTVQLDSEYARILEWIQKKTEGLKHSEKRSDVHQSGNISGKQYNKNRSGMQSGTQTQSGMQSGTQTQSGFNPIESFEQTILSMNNITKEQLLEQFGFLQQMGQLQYTKQIHSNYNTHNKTYNKYNNKRENNNKTFINYNNQLQSIPLATF